MININQTIEKQLNVLPELKLYQILPLRTSLILKYIPIDSSIIIDLFVEKKCAGLYDGNSKYEIWKSYFDKLYKHQNKHLIKNFSYLIYTDGHAVSILQEKKNNNKCYANKRKIIKKKKSEFLYLDELNKKELDELKDCKLVGIDPGKRNILSFIDTDKNKLRYTCMQRRFETGKNLDKI
jgi:hypothetical protein